MDFKRIGNRNMGLFFVGKLISVLGSSLFTFVAGLTILKVTGSGSSFAISLICGTLPRVLLAPFAGIVADRMNRRTLLIVSDIAGVVVMLLTFLSILFAPDSLLPIYLSLALLSVCSTFYSVAVSSSLMLMVDREQIVPLGMLTVGYLVDLVPVWILPIISAVAVAMITFFGHRRLREAARSHQPEQKSAGSAGIVQGGEVGV